MRFPREAQRRAAMAATAALGVMLSLPVSIAGEAETQRRAAAKKRAAAKAGPAQGYQVGRATCYANKFVGRRTASGERFDHDELTAAHRTLPMGTKVRVTRLGSGRTVMVRINDRGPNRGDAILDLSHAAAERLGMNGHGRIRVRLDIIERPASRAQSAAAAEK